MIYRVRIKNIPTTKYSNPVCMFLSYMFCMFLSYMFCMFLSYMFVCFYRTCLYVSIVHVCMFLSYMFVCFYRTCLYVSIVHVLYVSIVHVFQRKLNMDLVFFLLSLLFLIILFRFRISKNRQLKLVT
jgi:hypothetical protein